MRLNQIPVNYSPGNNFQQMPQGVNDLNGWKKHENFATEVNSLLKPGAVSLDDRENLARANFSAASDSNEAKVNLAADHALALKTFLSKIDLGGLHGSPFSRIFQRLDWSETMPELEPAMTKFMEGAREVVNTLTAKLKELPIPKFEPNRKQGVNLTDAFYDKLKELGLNTEF